MKTVRTTRGWKNALYGAQLQIVYVGHQPIPGFFTQVAEESPEPTGFICTTLEDLPWLQAKYKIHNCPVVLVLYDGLLSVKYKDQDYQSLLAIVQYEAALTAEAANDSEYVPESEEEEEAESEEEDEDDDEEEAAPTSVSFFSETET